MSKASSAVTPGETRQRPCLDSMGLTYFESRCAASPSGYERQATTQLSPTCSGHYRDGAVPWTTSSTEGPAAMLHKELYVKRIGNIREFTRT